MLFTLGFQSPCSNWVLNLIQIHEFNLILMVFLLVFLFLSLILIFKNQYFFIQSSSSTTLEFWWTTMPLSIVSLLLFPTLLALYKMNFYGSDPLLTLKVIGHQWYWEYDLMINGILYNFDSYISLPEVSNLRLLDSSPSVILPVNTLIRLLVTSSDVLHSFFLPSLGLKLDAVPGRLSEFYLYTNINGVITGMCAEICGKGHGAMPIKVNFISPFSFSLFL